LTLSQTRKLVIHRVRELAADVPNTHAVAIAFYSGEWHLMDEYAAPVSLSYRTIKKLMVNTTSILLQNLVRMGYRNDG
jgi:hypothetical protein